MPPGLFHRVPRRTHPVTRATVLALACALIACGDTGSAIEGTWRGRTPFTVVEEFTIAERGGTVSGSGTYCISDRCPTGTFGVRGTFTDPAVTLRFSYDSGTQSTFNGSLETSWRLLGTVTCTTTSGEVRSYAMTFARRVP